MRNLVPGSYSGLLFFSSWVTACTRIIQMTNSKVNPARVLFRRDLLRTPVPMDRDTHLHFLRILRDGADLHGLEAYTTNPVRFIHRGDVDWSDPDWVRDAPTQTNVGYPSPATDDNASCAVENPAPLPSKGAIPNTETLARIGGPLPSVVTGHGAKDGPPRALRGGVGMDVEIPDFLTLRTAIVEILQQRERKSCRLAALPSEVLRHLRMDLRGRRRRQFEAALKTSLVNLCQRRIVARYKAKTNIRVRLTPNYREGLSRLTQGQSPGKAPINSRNSPPVFQRSLFPGESQGSGSSPTLSAPPNGLEPTGDESLAFLFGDVPNDPSSSIIPGPTLPPLPPLDRTSLEAPPFEGLDEADEQGDVGEEDERLLTTLCSDEDTDETDSKRPHHELVSPAPVPKAFFSDLAEALEAVSMLEVRQVSSHLGMLVIRFRSADDSEARTYIVRLRDIASGIVVETNLPYVEAATTNILRAASNEAFSATIAIADHRGCLSFLVRKALPATRETLRSFLDHLIDLDRSVTIAKRVLRARQ